MLILQYQIKKQNLGKMDATVIIVVQTVFERQVTTGWNAPREWRLCTQCVRASTQSNVRGNSIFVNRLGH